ncbi:MAG: hydroxyacid dehydrogenase [Coriobacteriia bacterium]|nr:hydroxyacid dehydrogenase [Coriobacteriia bacterium]
MRIVLFEVEPWEREVFEPLRDAGHDVAFVAEPLGARNAGQFEDAEVLSTFTFSTLDRGVLERLPRLRLIATRSTGYDHIALDYCDERGVLVSNVPAYGCETVAEHVFALLLAISHRIVEAVNRTRMGDFSQRGLQGFDLYGKTMGVIGTGDIGRCTVRIAKGFGMEVLAFDVRRDERAAEEMGFTYVGLDELYARSDVITLHVPAIKATENMISEDAFAKMKDGVVLINTARGSIVDTAALVRAIAEKKVAAAGLDVLAEEPTIREEAELLRSVYTREADVHTLLANQVLLHLPNVLVTPHSGFNTREAVERILSTTRNNIESFLAGRPLNVVNEPAVSVWASR